MRISYSWVLIFELSHLYLPTFAFAWVISHWNQWEESSHQQRRVFHKVFYAHRYHSFWWNWCTFRGYLATRVLSCLDWRGSLEPCTSQSPIIWFGHLANGNLMSFYHLYHFSVCFPYLSWLGQIHSIRALWFSWQFRTQLWCGIRSQIFSTIIEGALSHLVHQYQFFEWRYWGRNPRRQVCSGKCHHHSPKPSPR